MSWTPRGRVEVAGGGKSDFAGAAAGVGSGTGVEGLSVFVATVENWNGTTFTTHLRDRDSIATTGSLTHAVSLLVNSLKSASTKRLIYRITLLISDTKDLNTSDSMKFLVFLLVLLATTSADCPLVFHLIPDQVC